MFPKATLYIAGLVGYKRIEGKDLKWEIGPHAQFRKAIVISFVPKGKRRRFNIRLTRSPYSIVLDGWGHPEPPDIFDDPRELQHGVAKKAKHVACDSAYDREFNDFLAKYTEESGCIVLADFRMHDPEAK